MFQESYMRKIVALAGVMAIIALGAYTYYTLKQAQYMYAGPTTISVTGVGEVFAKPDIATFNFTVEAKEADESTTQSKSAEKVNAILAYLKEQGVEEKDVKTEGYSLSPRYEYPQVRCTEWSCPPQGEPKLIGYQVSQTVTVKVRDTEKAGGLLSGVGEKGATNISGLSFTIDDVNKAKTEAREKAIADAKEQSEVLAKNLGVRIVRMNGYWEESDGGYPIAYGMGGDMKFDAMSARAESVAPELPKGENTITVRVNLTYEIK
ncbi:SIMPL domain-containing protein [Candidatus Kaiserbacteria bacterium]|nr:MAG: SIMPL domain-containing protein [Candidatus Kaiserbacteria bacterium]